jgi:hypothetical protein
MSIREFARPQRGSAVRRIRRDMHQNRRPPSTSPVGAAKLSLGRKPWVRSPHLFPQMFPPSPAGPTQSTAAPRRKSRPLMHFCARPVEIYSNTIWVLTCSYCHGISLCVHSFHSNYPAPRPPGEPPARFRAGLSRPESFLAFSNNPFAFIALRTLSHSFPAAALFSMCSPKQPGVYPVPHFNWSRP